jgi:hypothetical protein
LPPKLVISLATFKGKIYTGLPYLEGRESPYM